MIEKFQEKVKKLTQISIEIFSKYQSENTCKFKSIFNTYNGGTFKSKDYVENSTYKLITIKNVDDNGFNTTSTSYLRGDIIDDKYKLNIGDIVLTMTGNIGRTGIVDEDNCYLNQRVLLITSPSKLYLYCYLLKYKNNIIMLGKGTAQLNLSLEELQDLTIYNTKEEILMFKKYNFIFDLILNTKLQIKKLSKIKKLLLDKYF